MFIFKDFITSKEIKFNTLDAKRADRVYNIILKTNDPTFIEQTFNLITNNEYDINTLEAGIVINVIFSCIKLSGIFKKIDEVPDKIEEARVKVAENILFMFYKVIAKTQPLYTLDILKSKSINELLELIAFGDMIAGTEIIDTTKMRKLLSEQTGTVNGKSTPRKKGVSNVTQEELDFLKHMIANEEFQQGPVI